MSETLVQYGTSFQSKIIASLLTDIKFTKQIIDILEVSYFDSDSNKFLIKSIKEYFLKYKTNPTMEALKVVIDEIENLCIKRALNTYRLDSEEWGVNVQPYSYTNKDGSEKTSLRVLNVFPWNDGARKEPAKDTDVPF